MKQSTPLNSYIGLPDNLAALQFIILGVLEMETDKTWKITVQDKDEKEHTFFKTLRGTAPPSSEIAAVLIQDELVSGHLLPVVSRDCDEPTVYRLKVAGFRITSIGESE